MNGRVVSWSGWAAIIKYLRVCGSNSRCLFLTVLEARNSKIKGPVNSVPGESSLPSLQMATFLLCLHVMKTGSSEHSSSRRDTNFIIGSLPS